MDEPWWKTGVIYQIYPRSFQDTTGNGIGDLAGVTRRLDYVRDLDVDAIWLSPFYPSPMADFGYDVADYTDVDPLFGTLGDFEELVSQAHGRGLKVIVDYVGNHTSDQHPWFQESRRDRSNPKADWYVWADPGPGGAVPNNWLSIFGGSAWQWDEPRGQFYLHSFLKQQPDLNWRNPGVEQAMMDVLRFWFDRGVDGVRMDVIHMILKDPDLRDNPLGDHLSVETFYPEYEAQQHIHDKLHPDIYDVFRRMHALAASYDGDRVLIGEVEPLPFDQFVKFYGGGAGLHLPFSFHMIYSARDWKAVDVRSLVDEYERSVGPSDWPNYVLGNHDVDRLASRIGRDQARIGALLLLTLRGTPTLYYGDELAMSNSTIADHQVQDPRAHGVWGTGRDGCRSPMQWDAGPHGGFTHHTAEPWLPLNEDSALYNVAVESEDPGSMLNFYRRVLRFRRSHPVMQLGAYEPLDVGESVFAYTRSLPDVEAVIALNFSDDPITIRHRALLGKAAVVGTSTRPSPAVGDALTLDANEGVILLEG